MWDSLEITDYSMIQQMSCYCFPQEIIFPKKIIVKNDKNIVRKLHKLNKNIDNFYLDSNSIVYDCLRVLSDKYTAKEYLIRRLKKLGLK